MKKNKFLAFCLAAVVSGMTFTSCADDDEDEVTPTNTTAQQSTIAEIAINSGQTDSLVVALSRVDLVSTFQGSGNFTVFAPNNQAFVNFLATNTAWSSIADIDSTALRNVLLYHVLNTEVKAAALSETTIAPTLNTMSPDMDPTIIEVDVDGGATINTNGTFDDKGANIVSTDNDASNGVVHIIDKVIRPMNVVEIAQADNRFDSLVVAVLRANLQSTLSSADSTFTVFAPTNQAFANLIAEPSNGWNSIGDIPVAALASVLQYHVVSGSNVQASEIMDGATISALSGGTFSITGTTISSSSNQSVDILLTDVQGVNGVVHAIDEVLIE